MTGGQSGRIGTHLGPGHKSRMRCHARHSFAAARDLTGRRAPPCNKAGRRLPRRAVGAAEASANRPEGTVMRAQWLGGLAAVVLLLAGGVARADDVFRLNIPSGKDVPTQKLGELPADADTLDARWARGGWGWGGRGWSGVGGGGGGWGGDGRGWGGVGWGGPGWGWGGGGWGGVGWRGAGWGWGGWGWRGVGWRGPGWGWGGWGSPGFYNVGY